MNVLFVYPRYPESFWTFTFGLKIINRKAAYTPLGLLTVAAMVPLDWGKKFIDTNVHPLEDKDIMWADLVMISAVRIQKESVHILAGRIKQAGKKIIAGGPLFIHYHKEFPEIDHFVLGECESIFPRLLKDLKNDCVNDYYTSEEKPDLKLTPPPAWELINIFDYGAMSVQYSRGCPFDCDFCDIVLMYGRKPRMKSIDQFLRELTILFEHGWKGCVLIVDDNIISHKRQLKILLKAIIRWQKEHNYPFNFMTQASVDITDDKELLTLMRDAFFTYVFIGFESTNRASLNECGKYHNTQRDYREVVKIIHNYGMQVTGGFIIGFDNDNKDIFQQQIDIIQNTGMTQVQVSMLNAIPGTKLWHRLKKEGRLLKNPTGKNTDGTMNFKPKMDMKILQQGYRYVMKTIYTRKNYYKRLNDFLDMYNPHEQNLAISFNILKAFLKTLWNVGVVSPSRLYFWKLVLKAMVKKANALPVILFMTVVGEHYIVFTMKAAAKIGMQENAFCCEN